MPEKLYANSFADPRNMLKLGIDADCGCDENNPCQANFEAVWDATAETITFTDKSFLVSGDGIVTTTGIAIEVQDLSGTTPVTDSGDDSAPIVTDISTLSVDATFRVDYNITTDDGCSSTVYFFIETATADGVTLSPDPYNAIR